jgi:hypothetical protein
VRQVVTLTMCHASKSEVGALGLQANLPIFEDLLQKHPGDEILMPALVQIFASIARYGGDKVRDILRAAKDNIAAAVAKVNATVTMESDFALALDCLTVNISLANVYSDASAPASMSTLATMIGRVFAPNSNVLADAPAVLLLTLLVSYAESNKVALVASGILPALARQIETGSDKVKILALKIFSNVCFICNLSELVPELATVLPKVTSPHEAMSSAIVVLHSFTPRERRKASGSSLGGPSFDQIMLVHSDFGRSVAHRLEEPMQQAGVSVIVPTLGNITHLMLSTLHDAVDFCGAMVLHADNELQRSELVLVLANMFRAQRKAVIPVKSVKGYALFGYVIALSIILKRYRCYIVAHID